MAEDTTFGDALLEGLAEARAWKRGELALETVNIDPMPPNRIRSIRKKVAKSAKEFERRSTGRQEQEARRGDRIDPEQGESAYQNDSR